MDVFIFSENSNYFCLILGEVDTSIFRLYNISKRFTEGEIVTSCQNHGLAGYLNIVDGEPYYKSLLMKNIYYSSLTDTNLTENQESYFWRTFASFDGVRLKLNIKASNPNFRKMVYENTKDQPIALLHDLVQKIRDEHKREFVICGISKLCAFYLSKGFDVENEYRVLFRNWADENVKLQSDNGFSYVETPLSSVSLAGYEIDVIEVQSNEVLKIPSQYEVESKNS